MRSITICLAVIFLFGVNHTGKLEKATNWKLYLVQGMDTFKYPADTLKNFKSYQLKDDSVHRILSGMKEIPDEETPVWVGGPNVASCEMNGKIRKIDISLYGGFIYDEATKKYYQIAENRSEEWSAYIKDCFITLIPKP